MRVLVVDDETLAARHSDRAPRPGPGRRGRRLQGGRTAGAVKLAEELNPDLLFLDIQMPNSQYFEVLELLAEPRPPGFSPLRSDEFALRAFEVQAVDYCCKPRTASAPGRCGSARGRNVSAPSPQPSPQELAAAARPPGKIGLSAVLIRHDKAQPCAAAGTHRSGVEAQ